MRTTSVGLGLALLAVTAVAARADDPPGPAKPPAGPPAPKTAPPAPKSPETTPAPSVDDLVAKMADAKFAANRLDGARAAKDLQDAKLLAPLVKLLRDEDLEVRTAAIVALGTRSDPAQAKKAADALAERLKPLAKKPEHSGEILEVCTSLHDLAQPSTIDALLDDTAAGVDLDVVRARCFAVANIPSPKAVEALIDLMSKGHRDGSGVRGTAAAALAYATGERAVNDPDHWRAWWKEVGKSFDFAAAAKRREDDRKRKDEAEERRNKRKKKDGE
jgi:hypothetical protein